LGLILAPLSDCPACRQDPLPARLLSNVSGAQAARHAPPFRVAAAALHDLRLVPVRRVGALAAGPGGGLAARESVGSRTRTGTRVRPAQHSRDQSGAPLVAGG